MKLLILLLICCQFIWQSVGVPVDTQGSIEEIELAEISRSVQPDIEQNQNTAAVYHAPSFTPLHGGIDKMFLDTKQCKNTIHGRVRALKCVKRRLNFPGWNFVDAAMFLLMDVAVTTLVALLPVLLIEIDAGDYRSGLLKLKDESPPDFDKIQRYSKRLDMLVILRATLYPFCFILSQIIFYFLFIRRELRISRRASVAYNTGGKSQTVYHQLNEFASRLQWSFDLRHSTAKTLKQLKLDLLRADDLEWRIKFLDDEDADQANHDMRTAHQINNDSPLNEIARGRYRFILQATFRPEQLGSIKKQLFQMEFALTSDDAASASVKYIVDDQEYEFPPIILKYSDYLKKATSDQWNRDETFQLPGSSLEDHDIISLLADFLESNPLKAQQDLMDKSAVFKIRMLQLIDYLQLNMPLEQFLTHCLAPSCKDIREKGAIFHNSCSLFGESSPIPEILCRLFFK